MITPTTTRRTRIKIPTTTITAIAGPAVGEGVDTAVLEVVVGLVVATPRKYYFNNLIILREVTLISDQGIIHPRK